MKISISSTRKYCFICVFVFDCVSFFVSLSSFFLSFFVNFYNFNHTPDVHLNPDPNATCNTRSPFFSGLFF